MSATRRRPAPGAESVGATSPRQRTVTVGVSEKLALTLEEAAALVGVDRTTLRPVLDRYGVRGVHFGRAVRYPRRQFLDWWERYVADQLALSA